MPTTVSAPARRSARAHSASVLPVVTTSSTNQIRAGVRDGLRARNAPRTLRRRCSRSRPVWLGVARSLSSATGSASTRHLRATARASNWAGLKPRLRSRLECSGTGTIRSGGEPTRRAASPAASRTNASTTERGAGSSPARPRRGYLKRWIQFATSCENVAAAMQASSGERENSHAAHSARPLSTVRVA